MSKNRAPSRISAWWVLLVIPLLCIPDHAVCGKSQQCWDAQKHPVVLHRGCKMLDEMQWWHQNAVDSVGVIVCFWSLFFSWLRQYFIKIGWSPHYTYFNILPPSPSGHTISHLTIFSTIKKKGIFSSNEQRGRKVLEKPNTRKDKGRLQVNWQTNRSLLLFPTAR